MPFSENLRKLRTKHTLTQRQLSQILNISTSNISKYETGDLQPSIDVAVKIADFFKVPASDLLDLDKKKTTTPKGQSLTKDQQAVMRAISSLDAEKVQKVKEYLDFLRYTGSK